MKNRAAAKPSLAMQVVKFLKTNWFAFALLVIVVAAIVRKNLRVVPTVPARLPAPTEQPKPVEKYTDAATASGESNALLGIGGAAKTGISMPEIDAAAAQQFFKRFGKVTRTEQQKFGIPASVAVACAFVNSFGGQRELVAAGNNYFALPCSPSWTGQSFGKGSHCFRKYETAWESFRDFSVFVSGQEWFAEAKKSAGRNPARWAEFLEKQGLSDVQNFSGQVAEVISAYRLAELDK